MFRTSRTSKVSLILATLFAICAILLSPLFFPGYAEGDPPPEPSEEVVTEGDEGEPTEPTSEESVPDPEPETAPEVEAVDAPTEEPVVESEAYPEAETAIDEVEPVQETQSEPGSPNLVSAPDPYYVLGGITYRYSSVFGYCTANGYSNCQDNLGSPIQTAFDDLSGGDDVPDDNTVYVEGGLYTESPNIDGSDWDPLYLPNKLVLEGISGSGATTVSGSITISNLVDFILRGFTVTDGVSASGNSGTLTLEELVVDSAPGNGITVTNHSGDVVLSNVQANSNTGDGASLGTLGTPIGGAITVQNSTFNGNGNAGIYAIADTGPITLDNVTARDNVTGSGAELAINTPDPANKILVRNSTFKENGGFGVWAQPESGAVTFECLHAALNTLGDTMVPVGETVVWVDCPPGDEKKEKEPDYKSVLLSTEFPVLVNAGNGILVTFPPIIKVEEEKPAWGVVTPLMPKKLPAALEEDDVFRAGVDVEIINAEVPEGSFITVEFYIPGFLWDLPFSILWLDEVTGEWVEMTYELVPHERLPGGIAVVEWPEPGVFVIVTE